MPNTLLTSDIILRESLRVFHQKANFLSSIDTQYDDKFAKSGAKVGNKIEIRKANKFKVFDGATLGSQDVTEETVSLELTKRKHVPMTFSTAELTLDIDDFSKRYITPAISALVSNVEADVMTTLYKDVYNQIDNIGSASQFLDFAKLGKTLTDELVPYTDRCLNLNTQDNLDMVNDLKGLYNAGDKLSQNYKEGRLAGPFAGFNDIYENTHWPRHQTGSCAASTGYLVNGADQSGSTLAVDTGANTFKAGDIITIQGVNRVHPETKNDTGVLQTFVVTSDYAGGAGNLSISPGIVSDATDARQNVTASPGDNAPITKQGGASAAHGISMAYHKEAFTFGTADLVLPKGTDMASRKTLDGVSLRLIRDYTIGDDTLATRIDILYGCTSQLPEMACRSANN